MLFVSFCEGISYKNKLVIFQITMLVFWEYLISKIVIFQLTMLGF